MQSENSDAGEALMSGGGGQSILTGQSLLMTRKGGESSRHLQQQHLRTHKRMQDSGVSGGQGTAQGQQLHQHPDLHTRESAHHTQRSGGLQHPLFPQNKRIQEEDVKDDQQMQMFQDDHLNPSNSASSDHPRLSDFDLKSKDSKYRRWTPGMDQYLVQLLSDVVHSFPKGAHAEMSKKSWAYVTGKLRSTNPETVYSTYTKYSCEQHLRNVNHHRYKIWFVLMLHQKNNPNSSSHSYRWNPDVGKFQLIENSSGAILLEERRIKSILYSEQISLPSLSSFNKGNLLVNDFFLTDNLKYMSVYHNEVLELLIRLDSKFGEGLGDIFHEIPKFDYHEMNNDYQIPLVLAKSLKTLLPRVSEVELQSLDQGNPMSVSQSQRSNMKPNDLDQSNSASSISNKTEYSAAQHPLYQPPIRQQTQVYQTPSHHPTQYSQHMLHNAPLQHNQPSQHFSPRQIIHQQHHQVYQQPQSQFKPQMQLQPQLPIQQPHPPIQQIQQHGHQRQNSLQQQFKQQSQSREIQRERRHSLAHRQHAQQTNLPQEEDPVDPVLKRPRNQNAKDIDYDSLTIAAIAAVNSPPVLSGSDKTPLYIKDRKWFNKLISLYELGLLATEEIIKVCEGVRDGKIPLFMLNVLDQTYYPTGNNIGPQEELQVEEMVKRIREFMLPMVYNA